MSKIKNGDMPANPLSMVIDAYGHTMTPGKPKDIGLTKREYAKIHAPAMPQEFVDAWVNMLSLEERDKYLLNTHNTDGLQVHAMTSIGFKTCYKGWLDYFVYETLGGAPLEGLSNES